MTLLTSRHTVTALLVLALALRIAALEIHPIGASLFADARKRYIPLPRSYQPDPGSKSITTAVPVPDIWRITPS